MGEFEPAFDEDNVPVVVASSAYYALYMSVTLQSVIFCADEKHNYDLIVLHKEISADVQAKIISLAESHENISIRFIEVSAAMDQKQYNFREGYSSESFYRVIMMEYLSKYDSVLYLDSDVVVLEDVANLYYGADLSGKLAAATRDIDGIASSFCNHNGRKEYMYQYMGLDDVCDYFQSGVMVFNLRLFRETYSIDEIIMTACREGVMFGDQDVLNILCKGKVEYLDMSWNTINRQEVMKILFFLAPAWLLDEYVAAREHPRIIHYAGPKPWLIPDGDMAEDFWMIARQNPFYQEIINRETGKTEGDD